MSQEHSFDLRIAHSSPLFTASPLTGNRATGWSTLCTASGYVCDEAGGQSAVYTSHAGATMELEFWGSRIELRGNATGGMNLQWTLDGGTPSMGTLEGKEGSNIVGRPLASGLLAVFEGLDSSKSHKLKMTTDPSLPSAVMAFEGAVVTVGTGVVGGEMSLTYLDDTNPVLQYTQTPGGWAQYPVYSVSDGVNMTRPEGVTNWSFHCSKEPGESVNTTFIGTQVLLYGPCYSANGAYTVTIDNQDPVSLNASTNAYSLPLGSSVAGSCLRYISPPLSPDELHYVSMANADKGRETNLDRVLIVGNSGGQSISDGARKKGANTAAIAGAVAGSVALLIALGVLWFVLHRRRRRVKRVVARTTSRLSTDERKAMPVDLLSTDSNIPQLLDGVRQPNLLTNPSHGRNQSNATSYRRVEPFELPPLVDGAHSGGKPSHAMDSIPNSVSSTVPAAMAVRESISATSAPTMEHTSGTNEPSSPPPASQPPVPVEVPVEPPQPLVPPALPLGAQAVSHVHEVPQTQPSQAQHSQPSSSATPDLSQISSDVNRILAQLGQIRRGSGGRRGYSGQDDEDVSGEAPPEYGKHRRV